MTRPQKGWHPARSESRARRSFLGLALLWTLCLKIFQVEGRLRRLASLGWNRHPARRVFGSQRRYAAVLVGESESDAPRGNPWRVHVVAEAELEWR